MKLVVTKALLLILLVYVVSFSQARAQDPASLMISLSGTFYAMADSVPIEGSLFFEKLPYYDDMGTARASGSGAYEVYLLRGHTYVIKITSRGFEPLEMEYEVPMDVKEDYLEKDFYLPISEERRLIVLENLIFDSGRSKIRSESFEELDRLSQWINSRPMMIIQLEGHTDFQGNARANMELSQERVDAVKEYLVSKGVNRNRVLTKAFGGTQPVTEDRSAEGKAKNRRVELRVLEN